MQEISSTIQAGLAVVDITPPVGIPLAGYHRDQPSQGILDRLSATALILARDETPQAILLSVDNVGMLPSHVNRIREEIAQALKVSLSQVMIFFTHSHSCADTSNMNELTLAYRQTLQANLVHAARAALENLRPCTAKWGVAQTKIGYNRRVIEANGKVRHGVDVHGVTDDRIGVLRLDEGDSGRIMGVLVVCTTHASVLQGDNLYISADYPGRVRHYLTDVLHCPILIAIGGGGDSNPRWRGNEDALNRLAFAVSGATLSTLANLETQPINALHMATSHLSLDLANLPEGEEAVALAKAAGEAWHVNTNPWLARVNELHRQGIHQLSRDLELQCFRLNEGCIIGSGMELFAEIGLDFARDTQNEYAFCCNCVNGIVGYLGSATDMQRGGYEIEWMPVVYGLELEDYLMHASIDASKRISQAYHQMYASAFQ